MSRGPRISEGKKRSIACGLVAGQSLEEVAAAHGVTTGAIGRLRREDESFQAIEKELASVLVEEAQRKLRSLIGKAIGVLEEIAMLDHVIVPQGASKVLTERRRAANDLIKWTGELKARGEEKLSPVEEEIERQLEESILGKNRQREIHNPAYIAPPIPPLHFFRKPSEEQPE